MLVAPNVPSISVVVCAYSLERWNDLVAAAASVSGQTLRPLELVVVVDHNEHLLERARRQFAEAPDIRVVANESRQGLSGARNTGVASARGDIVAFLDDDARAHPCWLERLLAAYSDPHVVAAGGAVEPVWPERRPGWFPPEFDWVVGCTHAGMPDDPQPVRNLVGANMSFRRQALLELGGFRQGIGRVGTLPVGCEETELCIRVHQRWPDLEVRYEPEARVAHTVSADRATLRYFVSRCRAEGLSKALVAGLVGTGDGLASERAYVRRTLPAGMARAFGQALRGRASPWRALVIPWA